MPGPIQNITKTKDHSSSRRKCEKPGDNRADCSNKFNSTSFFNTCKVALQTQKPFFFFFLMKYTHKEVQVRKCPEQGSYLKFKDERNDLAGDFNFNIANTTKPLSFQFHLPHSFTAGSSSTALPKVILGKRKITTELIGTEQLIPVLCKLLPQLSQLLRQSFIIAASIKAAMQLSLTD